MSYRFPLQRLLELRQQHERAMARDLAQARDAHDAELQTRHVLHQAQAAAVVRVARETAESPTVGTLISLGEAMSHLDAHVELATERLRATDAVVQQRHLALTVAAQARQILDRLRERNETAYRSGESAKDLQAMDEIALSRFTKPDDTNSNRNRQQR